MKEKWILRHCDLDLWPKVTKFNRVRSSAISNHLAKTASKSVHPFGWNFVHKKCRTDRQTHTHTHTETNWSENITPPWFRGGVKKQKKNPFDLLCALRVAQSPSGEAQPYLPNVTPRVLRSVHAKFHVNWTKTVVAKGIQTDR